MDWSNSILPAIEHFRLLGYWLILIISFLESAAFIGYLFPGTIITILVGFSAAKGYFDIISLIWFAAAGAFLGDVFSYWWGRKGTIMFNPKSRIFKPHYLEKGQAFFDKHGDKSVLIGRFIGPLRPIIPFVAGVCGMKRNKFLIIDVIGALVWAVTYLFVGFFFGEAWQIIELWSTRIGIAAFIVIIIAAVFYLLRWILLKKGKSLIFIFKSVMSSIRLAITENSDIQKLVARYPRSFDFLKKRLDKYSFYGRPMTFLFVAFVYALFLLIGTIEDVINLDPLVEIDYRIANLMYAFRSVQLVKIFLFITVLCKWQIIVIFALGFSLLLFWWRRKEYIIPLWLSIGGSELFSFLGKLLIQRPRPEGFLPVYIEKSFAFPSNHAVMAVALYGFITVFAWRMAKSWKSKINCLLWGVVIIFIIGLSRVYLGVHYFGDVMGGYLLGAIWLIISFSFVRWKELRREDRIFLPYVSAAKRFASVALIFVLLAFYAVYAFDFQPVMNPSEYELPSKQMVSRPLDIFSTYNLNRYSETLSGQHMSPLSFIIIAKNDEEMINIFQDRGWYLSDPIKLRTLYKIAKASLFNQSYLMAPMTPSFWNRQVNDFGFQKPTESHSARERHHARFWRTNFVTRNNYNIYVGTASLDTGMKWLVTHKIDPAIDNERQYILRELEASGLLVSQEETKFVLPVLGKNFGGDQFFTDGNAYIVTLK